MAQWVKNLSAMQTEETWVPSLGQEDPLEEGIAVYSSILVWRITWMENPMDREACWARGHRIAQSWTD